MSLDSRLPPARSTQRWLVAAQAGSAGALGQALESCRTYLILIAREELDAELRAKLGASDLVQETLIAAEQAFDRFTGTNSAELLAWLRGILAHKIKEARRYHRAQRRAVRREIPLDGGPESARLQWEKPVKADTASRIMAAREEAEQIERALATLSPDHQQIIRLRNWRVLSFEEIGQRMGRTPSAARSLWLRALEQMSKALRSQDKG